MEEKELLLLVKKWWTSEGHKQGAPSRVLTLEGIERTCQWRNSARNIAIGIEPIKLGG